MTLREPTERRNAVIASYRREHRERMNGWRKRNREAERVRYYLGGGSITEARRQVDAWDKHGFGIPLAMILGIALRARMRGRKRSIT